jgi:DNA polymerase-1
MGPDKVDLAIVGEAPGYEEAKHGTPFVGKSGQLLTAILRNAGIDRDTVWVTNVCLCRPPGNATPSTAAVKACRPRLIQELQERRPNTVLALGNTAAKTLLDTRTGITELRKIPDSKSYDLPGVRILPTFHPAAALRSPDMLPSIIADVAKVNRIQVGWEDTKYKVAESVDQAIQLLNKQVQASRTLVLDIELEIDEKFRRYDPKRPNWLCFAISHRPGASVVYPREVIMDPTFRHWAQAAFENPDISWDGQNMKFDVEHTWEIAPKMKVGGCTMLRHYATDERKGTHDLEQLAVEQLGAPRYKTDTRQYLPYKGAPLSYLPRDILHQYNAADADITHRLIQPLNQQMEEDGVTSMYNTLMVPGSNALAPAEWWGVKLDKEYLQRVGDDLQVEMRGQEVGLAEYVGNPRSPQQVKAVLEDQLGMPLESTDKDHLKVIIEKYGGNDAAVFAEKLLEYRSNHKLYSTYVKGTFSHLVRGRVHPTFLLHGTETGRLSCRRPNLQNIPSGSTIRDAYMAGPDNILLSADYSQIEFRLAAIFAGDEKWIAEFKAGRSFHKEVALRYYGANYTDLQYLRAKAVNFGILYGRGAGSLAAEHKMNYSDAQRLITNFFAAYPKVKPWQNNLQRQIRERGYLESYYGRKRRFWLVTKDNWHVVSKEALNFPLQSTASDLTLLSLIRLVPLLGNRAIPVITVHDSLVFEVHKSDLRDVAILVKEVMEDTPFKDICPTPVELKVGQRWGKRSLELLEVA